MKTVPSEYNLLMNTIFLSHNTQVGEGTTRETLSTKYRVLFFAENQNLKVEAVVGALALSLANGPFLCYCSSLSLVKQPDMMLFLSSIPTMHQVLLRNVIYVYPCEYKFYVQILFQSPCFTKAGILFIALINFSYIYYLASFFPFIFFFFFLGGGGDYF